MKLFSLPSKQFQLVDSMLFGRVRLADFFSGAVEIFFRQRWFSSSRKKLACTPMSACKISSLYVAPFCRRSRTHANATVNYSV